ncbi:hypothetical protein [Vibrio rumoiensis]|uniref:hypothetical protein n=1 Tax=Vibrio rumoiensis TaxID=76258 RepID=UPI003AA86237
MLAELAEDKKYWQSLSNKTKEKSSKPKTNKVGLSDFAHSRKKTLKPASTDHIKEIVVAGENRTIYVRPQLLSRERSNWTLNKSDVGFKEALDALDPQKFKKKLQESLRQDLFKNKDIPKTLKANIAQWNVEGWNWKEWEAHGYINNSDGQTVFAVSSSAKLFRWAAQASADSKLELQDGVSADIGVGTNASFSLAEAAVKTTAYVPYKKGWDLSLTYQNENKEECRYSFGRFRFSAAIELSAFLGVTASGNAGATATTDTKVENPNPGTDIIIAPNVSIGSQDATKTTPGGNIGVKAEGFAGAQLGGQVTGAVEWLDPDDAPKLDFAALAQVTAEGNVAFGAGAGVDFQLALLNEKFYLHCSAQVVWGPGAKGGFATEIDGGKLFDLFIVIAKGLQYVDYRQLKNIESPVYEYFKNSTYVAFASEFFESPDEALSSYFNKGVRFVNNFFIESRKLREDALRIADNVLNDNSQVWEKYDQSLLFPETIGMMLNTLVTDFFWQSTEKQEKAICYLLSKTVTSWRKLSEILCRMNKDGHKEGNVNAMIANLTRINAILDGDQQDEFDDWILELSVKDKRNLLNRDGRLAYTPLTGDQFRNKEAEVRGKIARLTTPDSNEYIV